MKRFPLLICLALIIGMGVHAPAADQPYRTWTSSDGRTVEARYIKSTETTVTVRTREDTASALVTETQRQKGLKDGPYAASLTGEWEKMKSAEGIDYHFYAAKRLKPGQLYPLCIYLHGSSNIGSKLTKREPGADAFAKEEFYKDRPCFIIAPEAPEGTNSFKQIVPQMTALVRHLGDHLPINRDRIYVTGYSMGGYGSFDWIAAEPTLFAAAARGHANTELAGFLDAARAHGWRLLHVLSASANPGGPVTQDAFERLAGPIVEAARHHRHELQGIALGLHGAMVTEEYDDGEGELLRRLRDVVGPELPIAITLDLHANVTDAMCRHADIIVSYRTYPHTDMRRTGLQAGNILQRAMAGEARPVTLRASLPMLGETTGGRTDIGPMLEWLARARAHEAQEPDVFAVSLNAGFSHADIAEVGPSVLVTCQGDVEQHQAFADSLADAMWDARFTTLTDYLTVQQAAARSVAWLAGRAPLVVADYSDNPGGGAYGDSTALLAAMLKAGVSDACFGPMVDPAVAQALQQHAVGDVVDIELGGKTDPRFGGAPLALTCTLVSLHETGDYVGSGAMIGGLHRSWGPTAVVRVDGIEILVVSIRAQMLDLQQFMAFGIDPEQKRIVALKSMQHFRAAFEPIAGEVIVCDSGALCTVDYAVLPFAKVPRPVFPLDRDIDIANWLRANHGGIYIPG